MKPRRIRARKGGNPTPVFRIGKIRRAECGQTAQLLDRHLRESGTVIAIGRLAELLMRVIEQPAAGFVLLAYHDRQIIGFAYVAFLYSAEHAGLVAWLEELFVVPEHRAAGVGSKLLEAAIKRATAREAIAVELEMLSDHPRAASLYRRFHFETLERVRWVRRLPPAHG